MPSPGASQAFRSHPRDQTVRSLLAALIVHSANDAAVVLAHRWTTGRAGGGHRAARALHRPLPRIRWRGSSCS
jgi:D-alanyl-D-alanine carboxypeptidase